MIITGLQIIDGMTIVEESSVVTTSYLYWKWNITAIKTPVESMVQVSEFVFRLDGVDQSMSVTSITNPGGSNPIGEEVTKLNDGTTSTKLLDFNVDAPSTTVIFQFATAKTFNGYRWATANDTVGRDPASWTISASNDGTNYTTLHTVSNYVATSARITYQTAWTF
jgi:hypothetical protein